MEYGVVLKNMMPHTIRYPAGTPTPRKSARIDLPKRQDLGTIISSLFSQGSCFAKIAWTIG